MKKGLLTFAIGSAIVGGLVYICKSIKEEVTVKRLEWERSIDVEELKEVEETSPIVPEGATVTKVVTETVKDTPDEVIKKVLCYTYTIKKWVVKETVVVSGTCNDKVEYPDDDEDFVLQEGERINNRRESYTMTDTNGNVWRLDYDKWRVLCEGICCIIKHGRFNNYISKIVKNY